MDQSEKLCGDKKPNIHFIKCAESEEKADKIDKNPKIKQVKKGALSTCDSALAIFIIGPLVIIFWRVTWLLMDIYGGIHPNILPTWESLFFAIGILLTFALLRDSFLKLFKKKDKVVTWKDKIVSQIGRKFYTYAFVIVCIMHWRAVWSIGDLYFQEARDIAVFTSLCVILLISLRCLRNCIAPPLIVVLDEEEVTFTFPTRFRKKSTDKTSLYVLDCLFSVFIVGTLVVFVWRGAWVIVDKFLFPNDFVQSSWVSLGDNFSYPSKSKDKKRKIARFGCGNEERKCRMYRDGRETIENFLENVEK